MATPQRLPERLPERRPETVSASVGIKDVLAAWQADRLHRLYGEKRTDDSRFGQVILFTEDGDSAANSILADIETGEIAEVRPEDNVVSALRRAEMRPNPRLNFNVHLLSVPLGEEEAVSNVLETRYMRTGGPPRVKEGPDGLRFAAVPNFLFRVAGNPTVPFYTASSFRLTKQHQDYKRMFGLAPARAHGAGRPGIIVMDSGIAEDVPFDVAERRSFVPGSDPRGFDDYHHGTAVAIIINDVYGGAQIRSFKVIDDKGDANAFDVLATLCADLPAHVINLSLEFRPSRESQVLVMHRMVSLATSGPDAPILVAAAGNDGRDTYAVPACFSEVVAISAINYFRKLSAFSCYGGKDRNGKQHGFVFSLPGGDNGPLRIESICSVSGTKPRELWGTSFAAAYASAIIAATWAQLGLSANREAVLEALIKSADTGLSFYNYTKYGHGLLRFT